MVNIRFHRFPTRRKNYTEFIRKCYLEILNREPDELGFNHYLNLMEKNEIDEEKLVKLFKNSEECKRIEFKKKFTKKYDMNKNFYGKIWVGQDNLWYSEMFNDVPLLHANFIDYIKKKRDVRTVLEVGCGTGIYPICFKELFSDKKYVGIDISESAISYCRDNSKFDFICGDFLKMDLNCVYDLVFSNAVVDHVYDINLFFSKIVGVCRKYAYISAYWGFHPNLEEHEMTYFEEDGYYLNKLSVRKIKETLLKNGLKEDEFIIRPQHGGHKDIKEETVIEIERKY